MSINATISAIIPGKKISRTCQSLVDRFKCAYNSGTAIKTYPLWGNYKQKLLDRSFVVRDAVKSEGRIKCKQKSGRPFNRANATGEKGKGERRQKRNENVTGIVGGNKTWSYVDWFVYWTAVCRRLRFLQLSNMSPYPDIRYLWTILLARTTPIHKFKIVFSMFHTDKTLDFFFSNHVQYSRIIELSSNFRW